MNIRKIICGTSLAVLFLVSGIAHAATLSLPQRGPYTVGQTFSLPVLVSTSGAESVNAVSSVVSFPMDKLRVTSVTKGSLIDFWVQNPSFSNTNGTITFEGVATNPGFAGQGGLIVSVAFKVVGAGPATIAFNSASVLANDGQGTNILTGANSTTINLAAASAQPDTTSVPDVGTQAGPGPTITSSSHPDPLAWYNKPDVLFDWHNPSNVTAIRLGIDQSKNGKPTVVYSPPISHKATTVTDGIWYFHVQQKTATGWGGIGTYKVQVDTTPPNAPTITFPHGLASSDASPAVVLKATDALSGIDHYVVTINGTVVDTLTAESVKNGPYTIPAQRPGTSTISVAAYDLAGNYSEAQQDFSVEGIDAPKVDPIPVLNDGDPFEVSGISYPNARVDIFLKDQQGQESSQSVRTAANGSFRLVWPKHLRAGQWIVTAKVTDDKGGTSARSPAQDVKIKSSLFAFFNDLTGGYLGWVLLALFLLSLIAFGIWFTWNLFLAYRRTVMREIVHTDALMHKQFKDMKKALAAELLTFEHQRSRRELTAEEESFVERFQAILDTTEERIDTELKQIVKGGRASGKK